MSMRDYAVEDYGIVLTKEDVPHLEKVIGEEDLELWQLKEFIDVEYISEFTGEIFRVNEDGSIDWDNNDLPIFDDVDLVYFSIPKMGSLFHPAYSNMEELIADLKEKYGEYLPESYDYKSNFFKITGTYYG